MVPRSSTAGTNYKKEIHVVQYSTVIWPHWLPLHKSAQDKKSTPNLGELKSVWRAIPKAIYRPNAYSCIVYHAVGGDDILNIDWVCVVCSYCTVGTCCVGMLLLTSTEYRPKWFRIYDDGRRLKH